MRERHKAAAPGEWTRLRYEQGRFDLHLPGALFTKSNLRNPRPFSPDGQR